MLIFGNSNSLNQFMFNLASISLFMLLLLGSPVPFYTPETDGDEATISTVNVSEDICRKIFESCGLEKKLNYVIFRRAYLGMDALCAPRTDILTIIDFTKPGCDKRFYVIDLVNRKLLYMTLVAHGKNSGEQYCSRVSNKPKSLQSSPGFFLTAETYSGRQGYSLRLDGMEPGLNDLARSRAIVIHGADYVAQHYVDDVGYIGRSFGCPALPIELNQKIIDLIKGGTCLYIHTNDKNYENFTTICCD
jgi:hypothetical protein